MGIYKHKKFLYVGSFFKGSTVNQRYHDLSKIFHNIDFVNVNDFFPSYKRGLISIWRRLGFGLPYIRLKRCLTQKITAFNPEIIFFDKSLYIPPHLLVKIKQKGIKIFHFSNDDQLNPNNQSKFYLNSIKLYDTHFTTKSYNVLELLNIGAKNVFFVNNATSDYFIKPIQITKEDKVSYGSRVGFIGTYEKERAQSIIYLANNGIEIRIWGHGWNNRPELIHPNLIIENKVLWEEEYIKSICATEINLNFLRKENRDLQTQRSIEIPACKSFMLAEQSIEHENLFENNLEAVFFNSKENLLNEIQYYLSNDQKRREIAINGYQKCISNGYYYSAIFEKEFSKIFSK
jgi:spore maturation protein CgeB